MDSSDENEVKETLKKMAQFSISTNKINNIQERNLQYFPFVFFNGVKSARIEYDLTNHSSVDYDTNPKTFEIVYKFNKPKTDNFKIIYDLEMEPWANNEHLDNRFDALEKSIATLLWKGIPIEVRFNGKKVYPGEKND
jgi:hypothetical protein